MRFHALALLGVLGLACANDALAPRPVESTKTKCAGAGYVVTLSEDTVSLTVGQTATVLADVKTPCGADATHARVTPTSRNTSVASAVASAAKAVSVTGEGAGQSYVFVTSNGGGGDSVLAIVSAGTSCTPTATNLCPGDDVNAKVQAQGTGTAFTFGAGTFVQAQITPKTGQSFTGAGAGVTILRGTRTLTGWTQSGSNYFVGGQTQDVFHKAGFQCDATHPLCYQSEQLWVNDSLYIPVASTGALGAGKWYFDKSADRIYLPFNPVDSVVETSVTPYAIAGSATGVTVADLTVERYANSNGYGAIGYQTSGASWTISNVTAEENHGVGIKAFSRWSVTGSRMLNNGQMGYSCTGTAPVFAFDTIAGNNTAGNTAGANGEAGGGKCTTTDSLLIRQSYSHDNHGPGLWTDINNIHTRYDTNKVFNNDWRGIFHEISYDAVIRGNDVEGNGFNLPFASPAATDGGGILVSNSPNVEVVGNTVRNNKHGIVGREEDRGSGTHGAYNVTNLHVHDNIIEQTDAGRAGGTTDSDPNADPYSAAANNVWENNTYTLGASTKFRWSPNADKTWAQWRSAGQDSGSTESGQ